MLYLFNLEVSKQLAKTPRLLMEVNVTLAISRQAVEELFISVRLQSSFLFIGLLKNTKQQPPFVHLE